MVTAKTARTKRSQVQAKPIITSTEQLDDALRQLCDIKSNIDIRTAEMNRQITELKDQCDNDLADDLAVRARLEKDIEEYCNYYRDDIFPSGKKTLELVHGIVNFLSRSAVAVSKRQRMTTDACIDRIKQVFGKKADTYLHIKESLNKDALRTLDDASLDNLGLELQTKETFGISLKVEELAPASSNTTRQTA